MPRCNKKAEKIAFNILGKPGNMKKRKAKKVNDSPVIKNDTRYEEFSRITSK